MPSDSSARQSPIYSRRSAAGGLRLKTRRLRPRNLTSRPFRLSVVPESRSRLVRVPLYRRWTRLLVIQGLNLPEQRGDLVPPASGIGSPTRAEIAYAVDQKLQASHVARRLLCVDATKHPIRHHEIRVGERENGSVDITRVRGSRRSSVIHRHGDDT